MNTVKATTLPKSRTERKIHSNRTLQIHLPLNKMETSKNVRLEEKLTWKELVNFLHSYFKSLLETDIILFLLSFIAALTNAVSFTNGLKRSKVCLMFAKMYELKRIVTPGPALLCNFYVLSSFCIVFLCLWFFLKAHNNSAIYSFNSRWTKIASLLIPLVTIINYIMLLLGNQAFCNSFDVHRFCSSELMHNTDFKTFTPKYLDAYSYFDFSRVSLFASVLVCVLWTAAFVLHHKKHKQKLSPL